MSPVIENNPKPVVEKKALGRGLAALLGNQEPLAQNNQNTQLKPQEQKSNLLTQKSEVQTPTHPYQVIEVELSKIEPNPEQPRKHFNQAKLEELSLSLKEHGIVQPIVVRKLPNQKYQIIAGERRWRAANLADLGKIPVIVREANKSAQSNDLASLIENIQREDLSPIELAYSYERMIRLHAFTQDGLAQKLGISRVAVANTLRLLKLPESVKELVSTRVLSEGHSRALLGLNNEAQIVSMANDILEMGLTVRDVESRIRQINEQVQRSATSSTSGHSAPINNENPHARIEDELRNLLGTKVVVRGNEAKGTIEIYYSGKDSMNRIIHQLRSSKS